MLDIFRNEPETITLAPGEFAFRQGEDAGGRMFAILEGEIEIVRDGRAIAKLGQSEIVGEMALIDHVPRAAGARAVGHCKVAVVSEKRFTFLVQQHPSFAVAMLRMLTNRLRSNLES